MYFAMLKRCSQKGTALRKKICEYKCIPAPAADNDDNHGEGTMMMAMTTMVTTMMLAMTSMVTTTMMAMMVTLMVTMMVI